MLAWGFVIALGASAQQLDLPTAINEGLHQSPVVQTAESKALESHYHKLGAYQGFLPTITASGTDITQQTYLYENVAFPGASTTTAFPEIVPAYLFQVNAYLPLFDGFASTNRLLAAKSGETAAQNESDWTHFKVEKEITLQFYRALASQILKDVAEQNLTTITDHLRDVQLFKKAGVSTNYDVLRVEVQVSEAKTELMNAADNVEISRAKLAELLGEEKDERRLVGTLPVLTPEMIQRISQDSLASRQDLVGQQGHVEALEKSEKASNRFWVPNIGFFGTYFYYNNLNTIFPDNAAFRDAYQIGFSATWNLFDGMASYAKSREATEQRYQAEKGLRSATLRAQQDFDLWKRRFNYECSVYKSRVSDVEKSSETVRLAREGRKVGARTNTDLLDAESELFRARAGVVNAQMGAVEALVNLETTTGQRLLPAAR